MHVSEGISSHDSEIFVKEIRVNQGVGVLGNLVYCGIILCQKPAQATIGKLFYCTIDSRITKKCRTKATWKSKWHRAAARAGKEFHENS